MSDVLDDIGSRIQSIVTSAGYVLDKGDWRDDTDKRVCLFQYPGTAPQRQFGVAGVFEEFPQIQVCARGETTDYTGPEAVLDSIYRNLMEIGATTLTSGKLYYFVTPVQKPFPLRRDEKNRWEFACNFRVERRA